MEVLYINRKRGKKIWKENNIKDEEWRKYFKELLDGTEMDENTAGHRSAL